MRLETSHPCLVPGCPFTGRNQIGVRVRVAHSGKSPFPTKRRTDALISLESAGFLCDEHSLAGSHFDVIFTPNNTANASIQASCEGNFSEVRSKPIRQPFTEAA